MGRTTLSLRLVGELPPAEEISALLGAEPSVSRRRGEALAGGRDYQKTDVWLLKLGTLEDEAAETPRSEGAADALRRMSPALAALDRSGYRTELYVGSVETVPRSENETYAGGFVLPQPIVAAAAECGLEVRVSTLIIARGAPGAGGRP